MSKEERITAAAARMAARNFRLTTADELDAPAFNSTNPLLPNTADDQPNQLHKDLRGTELKIDIPAFDQGEDGRRGIVTLFWNGEAVAQTPQFLTPIKFPLEMKLPASATGSQGSYELSYAVNIVGNVTPSLSLVVNIDTTPPNRNQRGAEVVLPAEVEAGGITKEYLENNGGKVVVTVPPDYLDAKIDDEVILMFGPAVALAREVGRFKRTDLTRPIQFDLLEADIKHEGENSLFYILTDRKGNEGPHSAYKIIPVMLTPAPTNLLPPLVPVADDNRVDYADAVQGVKVIIRAYDNWFANDRVVVTFDGTDHAPQPMPQGGATVNLPFALIYSGDYGEKDSRVTYRIERNGRPFPESVGRDFKVDLRMPGPDPIDPPGEVHPDLNILTVKGAVSADNVLTEADADQNVKATAAIYPNPGADQYARLWWNGKDTGLKVDLAATSTEIAFDIPWAIVKDGGNGSAIPVHYVVGHALNDNVYHSRPRDVDVSGIKIVLPVPAFQHLDPTFDVLNCPSLRVHSGALHAEIQVPGDQRLAGKELTFTYQGWSDAAGTIPIPSTSHTFNYTPNEDQARDGFTVLLPYETALKETKQAWGSIQYTVDIDGVPGAPSERHLVDVEVQRPGGLACEIPLRSKR